jgi:hypothetical protein
MHRLHQPTKVHAIETSPEALLDVRRHTSNATHPPVIPHRHVDEAPSRVVDLDYVACIPREIREGGFDSWDVIRDDEMLWVLPEPIQESLRCVVLQAECDITHSRDSIHSIVRGVAKRNYGGVPPA